MKILIVFVLFYFSASAPTKQIQKWYIDYIKTKDFKGNYHQIEIQYINPSLNIEINNTINSLYSNSEWKTYANIDNDGKNVIKNFNGISEFYERYNSFIPRLTFETENRIFVIFDLETSCESGTNPPLVRFFVKYFDCLKLAEEFYSRISYTDTVKGKILHKEDGWDLSKQTSVQVDPNGRVSDVDKLSSEILDGNVNCVSINDS